MVARRSRKFLDENRYAHIAVSANGRILAGISQDERQLHVWNLVEESLLHGSSLEQLGQLTESRKGAQGDRSIAGIVVSNDGRSVACLVPRRGIHGHVVLLNCKTGQPIGDAHELANMESWPAFSPSSDQIVTPGYMDTASRLSTITEADVIERTEVRGTRIDLCAAFSPDGTTLAVAGLSHDVRLYDQATGRLKQTLNGHTRRVASAVFSQDGQRILSGSLDGTVRNLGTGDATGGTA